MKGKVAPMSVMKRVSLIFKSKANRALDRMEDPRETLDYSYEKQLELLQNVKRGIADVVTAKKRLELQETKLQDSVVKLDTQARQALAAGREDLARQALERKSGLQQQLQSLDQQTQQLEAPMNRVRHRGDLANQARQFLADIGDAGLYLAVRRGALKIVQPQRERHHPLADVLVQRLGERCALLFVRLHQVAAQI